MIARTGAGRCDPSLIDDETPAEDVLKFPGGLLDFLKSEIGKAPTVTPARLTTSPDPRP